MSDETKDMPPGFEKLHHGVTDVALKLGQDLNALYGSRVSFVICAVPVDEAERGRTRTILFSNECVHNRLILLDGARELTQIELARTGARS